MWLEQNLVRPLRGVGSRRAVSGRDREGSHTCWLPPVPVSDIEGVVDASKLPPAGRGIKGNWGKAAPALTRAGWILARTTRTRRWTGWWSCAWSRRIQSQCREWTGIVAPSCTPFPGSLLRALEDRDAGVVDPGERLGGLQGLPVRGEGFCPGQVAGQSRGCGLRAGRSDEAGQQPALGGPAQVEIGEAVVPEQPLL